MLSETVLLQIFNGITLGIIYALFGMGLTLIWSIAGLPDFSQGGIYIITAYAAYFAITLLNTPYFFAIFFAIITGMAISVTFERLLYSRLRESHDAALLCAIALFFLLENLSVYLWTPKAKIMPSPLREIILKVAGVSFSLQRVIIIAVGILFFVLVNIFVKKTKIGLAIIATAQDREAAALMGINLEKVYITTWALGGLLTALASVLISPLYAVHPGMGTLPLLKALVVVILGGMGSFIGALVAGLTLGLIETFGAIYISIEYQHGFAFIILLLTLVLRPQGLFGRR